MHRGLWAADQARQLVHPIPTKESREFLQNRQDSVGAHQPSRFGFREVWRGDWRMR